jgi:hypothetical protein
MNPIMAGATVAVTTNAGTLSGTTSYTFPNSFVDATQAGGATELGFTLSNPTTLAAPPTTVSTTITVKITSSKGIISTYTLTGTTQQ